MIVYYNSLQRLFIVLKLLVNLYAEVINSADKKYLLLIQVLASFVLCRNSRL